MSAPKNVQKKETTKKSARRLELLESYIRCCLCGSELEFVHTVDYGGLAIQEEAHCPSCSIKTKSSTFTLQ